MRGMPSDLLMARKFAVYINGILVKGVHIASPNWSMGLQLVEHTGKPISDSYRCVFIDNVKTA
jgi:hypothetical protein